MHKGTLHENKRTPVDKQHKLNQSQTRHEVVAPAIATPQPPMISGPGPSQSAQVPEFSNSEDFEANYHENFDDPNVFSSDPSPAYSLVLHYPTNPFTSESTPIQCFKLWSSTEFRIIQDNTSSSPYSGFCLLAPNSSPPM
ncbi:hypothetical protein K443DRAFT_10668 [Laccaria amethystina LaAM-08-1]|uniref:Uncharacterized protein n=1 Tax=Laccaria amethystina LaAM-08-1 TaxID=1095629 RepID=A0A0C9XFE6_9AGAR|nr:hypothetical protein K443DRAFT_10668 [Laccaria amethystina LaAM-08-1]